MMIHFALESEMIAMRTTKRQKTDGIFLWILKKSKDPEIFHQSSIFLTFSSLHFYGFPLRLELPRRLAHQSLLLRSSPRL